jgi:predicted outer membrane protein
MRIAHKVAMLFALLGLALVGNVSATSVASANTEVQRTSSAEAEYLRQVRQTHLYLIRVNEIVQVRATSTEVRNVARQIADSHRRLDAQLTRLARARDIALPAALSASQTAMLSELRNAQGGIQFEDEYLRQQILQLSGIEGQSRAIGLVGVDSQIQDFARTMQQLIGMELTQLWELFESS